MKNLNKRKLNAMHYLSTKKNYNLTFYKTPYGVTWTLRYTREPIGYIVEEVYMEIP